MRAWTNCNELVGCEEHLAGRAVTPELGAELAAALRARAVLARHFAEPERIAPYLRISVGSEREIARLLSALEDILSVEA